jgi:hypothetical protein
MRRDIHKHRCGLHLEPWQGRNRQDPPLSVAGCGHEWEHERVFNSSEDYANRHRCPNCGAGPWYARVVAGPPKASVAVVSFDDTTLEKIPPEELAGLAAALLDALGFDWADRFERIETNLRTLLKEE